MAIMKNSKIISKIAKELGGVSDDVIKGAAKKLGYETTEKTIHNAGKAVDMDLLKNTVNSMIDSSELQAVMKGYGVDRASAKSILRRDRKTVGKAVESIGSNARASAEVFEQATHQGRNGARIIGDKNKFYVPTDGDISGLYDSAVLAGKKRDAAATLSTRTYSEISGTSANTSNATSSATASSNATTTSGGTSSSNGDLKGKTPEQIKSQLDRYRDQGVTLPGDVPVSSYITSELKGRRYDSKLDYMRHKVANEWDGAIKDFEAGNHNNPLLENLKKEGVDFKSTDVNDLMKRRSADIRKTTANDMQFGDWMGYNQVPQKAVAGMGTVWLVNRLASTQGQQTNAQLYGQQPY